MKKIFFVTWAKMPEVVGGCESIFKDLADNLNGELLTYPYKRVFQTKDMPTNFQFHEEYKSWMFDDILNKMLKDNPNTPIVANAGCVNIWKKHNTRIINLFNDPYRKAQKTMKEHGSKFFYLDAVVNRLSDLQKIAAEGAINVAVSKIMKEAMKDEGIKCNGIMKHGVDGKLFCPLNKTDLKEKYGIEGKVGLFVGLTHPVKNWFALKDLINERSDITWILVLKMRLEDFFAFGNTHVFYKLPREQMPEIYNLADFVIVPSYFESFGLITIEAGMCGVPSITSKVGWVEDNGVTDYGIVVDDFKSQSFSKAIDQLSEYDFKPRAYMQKRFNFKRWINKWRRLIKGDR